MRRPTIVAIAAAISLLALTTGAVGADRLGESSSERQPTAVAALVPLPDLAPESFDVAVQSAAFDAVPVPLQGCPPPPRPPDTGPPPDAWHPPVLVAEADLPAPEPAPPWAGNLDVLQGKGMWVWQYRQTEAGNADAIVARAVSAGLRQLWVRVGDSRDGFYGAETLAVLVPKAHQQGLAVIGWGFPFLWDPVDDAQWSGEALAWRGPDGAGLDGFSPDIEMQSEGVALSERRAAVYLDRTRRAAGRTLLVATVYRPSDTVWGRYPYESIAPYVDAFAPMVYWGCTEPGEAALQTIERLASMRPVHLIGQAYDMAEDGAGRAGPPNADETRRFLDMARRRGAVGASFWVWQSIDDDQWAAMAGYPWPAPVSEPARTTKKGTHD
ncbi:MAG TPA: hypothetical protein VM121_01740 [Acidimicrobiales bacterium]|nr:hypothetical protein [Acidimicrobiales bacterium]